MLMVLLAIIKLFDSCINPKLAKKIRETKLYKKGAKLQKSKNQSNK